MKTRKFFRKSLILAFALAIAPFGFNASAQISAPAPGAPVVGGPGPVIGGSGLNTPPPGAPVMGGPGPVIGGSGLNGPLVPAPAPAPLVPIGVNPTVPNWQNGGVMNVVAVGYDAQGVYRTIPLRVAYTYNGVNYDVNVLSAWNPWTDCWNMNVDVPAFQTTYYLNGNSYNYYTNLSTGTFYFNL